MFKPGELLRLVNGCPDEDGTFVFIRYCTDTLPINHRAVLHSFKQQRQVRCIKYYLELLFP